MKIIYLLFILTLSLNGCFLTNAYNNFLENHPNLTYDEAIMEFGSPTESTEGKNIYVVTWDKRQIRTTTEYRQYEKGKKTTDGEGKTQREIKEYEKIPVTVEYLDGKKIIVTFNKENDRMVHWKVCTDC